MCVSMELTNWKLPKLAKKLNNLHSKNMSMLRKMPEALHETHTHMHSYTHTFKVGWFVLLVSSCDSAFILRIWPQPHLHKKQKQFLTLALVFYLFLSFFCGFSYDNKLCPVIRKGFVSTQFPGSFPEFLNEFITYCRKLYEIFMSNWKHYIYK